MRLAVLTPVGPGHEWSAWRAYSSSCSAWNYRRGPFTEFRHFFFDDTEGLNGRMYGRNALLERARSWGADWLIHLDANDMIHPAAYHRIGQGMDDHPDAQLFVGCHSMLLNEQQALHNYDPAAVQHTPYDGIAHVYRTRHDRHPLYWGTMIDHNHWGTSGTICCIKADLSYKIGFLPELPAGDFWEHQFACMAHAPFAKLRHPIVITDRVTPGAKAGIDKSSDHGDRLDTALDAIHHIWATRGRTPFSYAELEERWSSRFKRRQDFEELVTIHDDWSERWLPDVGEKPLEGST